MNSDVFGYRIQRVRRFFYEWVSCWHHTVYQMQVCAWRLALVLWTCIGLASVAFLLVLLHSYIVYEWSENYLTRSQWGHGARWFNSFHNTTTFQGYVQGLLEAVDQNNISSDKSTPSTPAQKRYRIVACTKVAGEVPYILEWIEFHRLQGVDKFVLYHDAIPSDSRSVRTALQVHLLPYIYRQVTRRRRERDCGLNADCSVTNEDVIDVIPGSLAVPDRWAEIQELYSVPTALHRTLQPLLVADCVEKYRDVAEYILHLDVDEFFYSPSYPSAYAFLQDFRQRNAQKNIVAKALEMKPVGFHIDSVTFGSSGSIWDFHNSWHSDPLTGEILTTFDPRDSSIFQLLINEKSSLQSFSSEFETLLVRLFKQRLDRLQELNFYPFNTSTLYNFFVHKLSQDYGTKKKPSSATNVTTDGFKSGLRVEDFGLVPGPLTTLSSLPLFEYSPGITNGTERRVTMADMLNATLSLLQKYKNNTSLLASAPSATTPAPLKPTAVGDGRQSGFVENQQTLKLPEVENDSARIHAYRASMIGSLPFYPLIITEQTLRQFHRSYDEPVDSPKKWLPHVLPVCALPQEQWENHLRQTLYNFTVSHNDTTHTLPQATVAQKIKVEVQLLQRLCVGAIPNTITQIGKSIYFTDMMRGSHATLGHTGLLRGCPRPDVHYCAHKIYGGMLKKPDVHRELRIDHHQFRSYERRTFALPDWRGGPLGYAAKHNWTMLQSIYHVVRDETKLRFLGPLWERLLDIEPLPIFPSYRTIHSLNMEDLLQKHTPEFLPTRSDWELYPSDILATCHPMRLITEKQTMCPKAYPYVGITRLPFTSPHPYGPYSWCADFPMDNIVNRTRSWDSNEYNKLMMHFKESIVAKGFEIAIKEHLILCPTYGSAGCCTYNEELEALMNTPPASSLNMVGRALYPHGWQQLLTHILEPFSNHS